MKQRAKVDRLLESAFEKLVARDPDFLMDLVITPTTPDAVEPLVKTIERLGGKTERVLPEKINARVPVGKVEDLASSPLVSSARLARLHRMH